MNRNDHLDDRFRLRQLNSKIEELFGELADDEILILSSQYKRSEARAMQVGRVRPQSSTLLDLKKDIEFRPVQFPKELIPLLRKNDAFFATIGLKSGIWTVLHMNPCYETNNKYLNSACISLTRHRRSVDD